MYYVLTSLYYVLYSTVLCTVPVLCQSARLQVRLHIARVQVGDGHEEARPSEGPQLPETEAGALPRPSPWH